MLKTHESFFMESGFVVPRKLCNELNWESSNFLSKVDYLLHVIIYVEEFLSISQILLGFTFLG